MNIVRVVILIFLFSVAGKGYSTTWDEPWQDKVIKEADYFVLAKIKSFDEKKGVKIEIIKSLAGKELSGKIEISDFYLLDMCSRSDGHGAEFEFEGIKESYFFIKKNEKGEYCIATPTSGFANIIDGNVYATYRHSYHQALVPVDVYEKTMQAIFKNYHGEAYDTEYINQFVNKYLSMKPAGFDEGEIKTFFLQHVSLECVYHLKITGVFEKIMPFFNYTSNFHSVVSAARALRVYNTNECKEVLMKAIADTSLGDFAHVMCIWSLSEFKPTELKERLKDIEKDASTESNGFGGNIMDPRVCTHMPRVKDALNELIEKL